MEQEIKKYYEISDLALEELIERMGLNGKEYIDSFGKIPYFISNDSMYNRFISPEDGSVDDLVDDGYVKKDDIETAKEIGIIELSEEYFKDEKESEKIITLIHEKMHAKRNLLIHDLKNDENYLLNNGIINPMSTKNEEHYADPGQEILHGSIDSSKKNIDKFLKKSSEEKEDLIFDSEETSAKIAYDMEVDETLIELMSYSAFYIYSKDKEKKPEDKKTTIEEALSYIKDYLETEIMQMRKDNSHGKNNTDIEESEKLVNMSKIILRHGDYELFKWMLYPVEYTMNDIHYDFFKKYTEGDGDLTAIFSKTNMVDDNGIDEIISGKGR